MGKAPSKSFDTLYRQLNPAQKEAVDAIEGPVMVVAGPGTGKTQVLTLRIANILKRTDTPADAILALTFTESAAFSLKKRLVDIVGGEGYRVRAHTFHGFSQNIIERFPDAFPRIIGGAPIHEAEKILLLKRIIETGDLSVLRPSGDIFYHLSEIKSHISSLKRERILPDRFSEHITSFEKAEASGDERASKTVEKDIAKQRDLLFVYSEYEKSLREEKLYDYDDMIVEVSHALEEDETLRLSLQEDHQYILADEHQDANGAQNTILELLGSGVHENPNLFIVGDEKQAIFRFQGGSLDHFAAFAKKYPGAKVIDLSTNYRSSQEVLDAASSVIEHNPTSLGRERVHLQSSRGEGTHIRKALLPTSEHERFFIASSILEDLRAGIFPHEIAVITRRNQDAVYIGDALSKRGIANAVESDQSIFQTEIVMRIITLFEAVVRFGDDRTFLSACLLPFLEVDPHDVYRLSRLKVVERKPIVDLAADSELLTKARIGDGVHALYKKLSAWRSDSEGKDPVLFLEELARESGLIAYIAGRDGSHEEMETLRAFLNDIRPLSARRTNTLEEVFDAIATMREYGVGPKGVHTVPKDGRVRVMTAHRAKGLEFDSVYIVRAQDGVWGNRKNRNKIRLPFLVDAEGVDDDEEERRLFYVAMTRAKDTLTITLAEADEGGRMKLPSQFVDEIQPALIKTIDVETFVKGFDPSVSFAGKVARPSLRDTEVIRDLFLSQGLSVSALNNYIKSPWLYFVRNLVRVPEMPTPSLEYGSAMHAALQAMVNRGQEIGEIDLSYGLVRFESELSRRFIPETLRVEYTERGSAALKGYVAEYRDEMLRPGKTELSIEVPFDLLYEEREPLRLRGAIDRVIVHPDDSVTVIDYKTGSHKSRNHIEGKTKDATSGDMKRQLIFYKILLARFMGGRWRLREAIIDFIEPNDSGKYRREVFTVSEEEEREMEETIRRVAGEIWNLSFWDTPPEGHVLDDFYLDLIARIRNDTEGAPKKRARKRVALKGGVKNKKSRKKEK